MEHPKAIGETSQLAIMLGLDRAGYAFFVPFGENTRYDLVIDEGDRLARVQRKTGRLKAGAVRFRACSSYAHHPNPKLLKRDYLGEIDYFGVYCPETNGVYLVLIEHLRVRREGALRRSNSEWPGPQSPPLRRLPDRADFDRRGVRPTAGSAGRTPGRAG